MKLKKLLTVLLVVLLTLSLVLVAACNNNDSPDPENPDNTNPGGTTPGGSTSGGTTTQKAEHPSDHTYEPVWEHGKYDHWQACGHEGCTYIDIDSYNYHEYVDGVCKDCGEPDDPNDDYPFTDMPEVPDPPIGGGGGGTGGVPGDYVVVGSGSLGDWANDIERQRLTHYTDNPDDPNQSIRLNLKQGDEFKIKVWNSGDDWTGSLGANSPIWFDGGETGLGTCEGITASGLFVASGENIQATQNCDVSLTIHDNDSPVKLCIYVHDYDGTIEKPDLTYIVVGTINGYTDWSNNSTHWPLQKNDDGSFSITLTALKYDDFKVWEYGTYNAVLDGNTHPSITFAPGVKNVSDVFGVNGDGNAVCNYNITFTITVKNGSASVHVTKLEEGTTTIEYYLRGTMNNWSDSAQYKFTAESNGTYTLKNLTLNAGDTFKVRGTNNQWYGYDSVTGSGASNFSKDSSDSNGNILVNVTCTVNLTFNPSTGKLTIEIA